MFSSTDLWENGVKRFWPDARDILHYIPLTIIDNVVSFVFVGPIGHEAIGNYAYNHEMDAWTRVPPRLNQCCGESTAACTLNGKIYVLDMVPAHIGS